MENVFSIYVEVNRWSRENNNRNYLKQHEVPSSRQTVNNFIRKNIILSCGQVWQ